MYFPSLFIVANVVMEPILRIGKRFYLNVEINPLLISFEYISPVEKMIIVHHMTREIRLKI